MIFPPQLPPLLQRLDAIQARRQAVREVVVRPTVAAPIDAEQMRRDVTREVTEAVVTEFRPVIERAVAISQETTPAAYLSNYLGDYRVSHDPSRRPREVVSMATLRRIADMYDPLRSAINHHKREIAAIPLRVVPVDDKDDSAATKAAIKECEAFIGIDGGLGGFGRQRRHFESEVIEDLLITGAMAVSCQNSLASSLLQCVAIDASTIRPLISVTGFAPTSNTDIAYEQWIDGVPRGSFSRNQLYYDGMLPVTTGPYFKSPVEYLIGVITSALKADDWNRSWLTDGNTSKQLIECPADWKPGQIKEYAEYFDAILAGDNSGRVKARYVPQGMRAQPESRKEADFASFEFWLLERTLSIMGVNPSSVGYHSRQYQDSQKNAMAQTSLFGSGDLLRLLVAFYDYLWQRLGYGDLVKTSREITVDEDPKAVSDRAVQQFAAGVISQNEARALVGAEPVPGEDLFVISNLYVTLASVINPPEPEPAPTPAPETAAAAPGADPNVDPAAPAEPATPETESPAAKVERAELATALRQWERKALNRIKTGKRAVCHFESPALTPQVVEHVLQRLESCADARAVKRLFTRIDRAEGLPRADVKAIQAFLTQLPEEGKPKKISDAGIKQSRIEIARLADGLHSFEISNGEWADGMRDAITAAHGAQAVIGFGGEDAMTDDRWDWVSDRLAKVHAYFDNFEDDVNAGRYDNSDGTRSPAIMSRSGQYADSSRYQYENARVVVAKDDGHTWGQRIGGAVEHCPGCQDAIDAGRVPLEDVVEIGDDSCECAANCHCIIVTGRGPIDGDEGDDEED